MARQKGAYVPPANNRGLGNGKDKRTHQHLNGSTAHVHEATLPPGEEDTAFTQFFNSTFVRIALFVSVAVILLTAGTVKSLNGDVVVAVSMVAKGSLSVVFSAYRLFFSATTLHVFVTSSPEDPCDLLSLQLLLMSVMGLHLELPVFEPFYAPALMYSRYVVLRNLNNLFQHKDLLSTFCMGTFIIWSEAEAVSFGIPPPWRITFSEFLQQTLFAFRWALIIWIGVVLYLYLNWRPEDNEAPRESTDHNIGYRKENQEFTHSGKANKPRFVAAIVLSLTMLLTAETIQLSSDSSLLQPSTYKRTYEKMEFDFVSKVWPDYGPPDMEVPFEDEVAKRDPYPDDDGEVIHLDTEATTEEDDALIVKVRDKLESLGMKEKDMIRLVQLFNLIKSRGAFPPDRVLYEEHAPAGTFMKAERVLQDVARQVGWNENDLYHVRALLNMIDRVKANEKIESALSSVQFASKESLGDAKHDGKGQNKKSAFSASSLFQSEAEGQGPTPALGSQNRNQFFQSDIEVEAPIKKGDNVIMPSRRSTASQTVSAAIFSFFTNLWAAVSSFRGILTLFATVLGIGAYVQRKKLLALLNKYEEMDTTQATVDPNPKLRGKRRFGRKRGKTDNEEASVNRAYSTAENGHADLGAYQHELSPVEVVQSGQSKPKNIQASEEDNTAKGRSGSMQGESVSSGDLEHEEPENSGILSSWNTHSKKGSKKKRKRKTDQRGGEEEPEREFGQRNGSTEEHRFNEALDDSTAENTAEREETSTDIRGNNTGQSIPETQEATTTPEPNDHQEDESKSDIAPLESSKHKDARMEDVMVGDETEQVESEPLQFQGSRSVEEELEEETETHQMTENYSSDRNEYQSTDNYARPGASLRQFTDEFWDPTSENSAISSQIGVLPISAPHMSTDLAIEQAISSLTEFQDSPTRRGPFMPDDREQEKNSSMPTTRHEDAYSNNDHMSYNHDALHGDYGSSLSSFALGMDSLDLGLGSLSSGRPLQRDFDDDDNSDRY
eukprot:gb/GECG01011990.1/.p1 GENE.gb/GECG01011990.1/~~gb/GECG01011990.1/.p1  ORF type:complete len:1006 (+),score=160.27 gb/GECG01011990.1/:1-3018(+)